MTLQQTRQLDANLVQAHTRAGKVYCGRGWLGIFSTGMMDLATRIDTKEGITAVSTAEPAEPPHFWVRGEAVVVPPPLPKRPPTTRDRFDELKGWIAGAYYSSEIGMRELGWTGQVFFASFPGCEHPGGHR